MLSIIGLILDIIGVTILYIFGISPTLYDQTNQILRIGVDQTERRKSRIFKSLSKFGFILILLGFILQFLGSDFIQDLINQGSKT